MNWNIVISLDQPEPSQFSLLLEVNPTLTLTDLHAATNQIMIRLHTANNQILIAKINLVPVDLGCSSTPGFPVNFNW